MLTIFKLLAILTVISNGAISFALTQGAIVSFWLRALRGTTLVDLHRDWAYGMSNIHALGDVLRLTDG